MTEIARWPGKLVFFLLAGNWVLAGEPITQPNPTPSVFVTAVAAKKHRPVGDFVVGPTVTLPGTGDPVRIEILTVTDSRVRPVDVCFAVWSGSDVVVFEPRSPRVSTLPIKDSNFTNNSQRLGAIAAKAGCFLTDRTVPQYLGVFLQIAANLEIVTRKQVESWPVFRSGVWDGGAAALDSVCGLRTEGHDGGWRFEVSFGSPSGECYWAEGFVGSNGMVRFDRIRTLARGIPQM